MRQAFLPPDKPLSICREETCEGCELSGRLVCHFNGRQLGLFILLFLPLFIAAGYGLWLFSPRLLVPWFGLIVSYFLFIEIRLMCSHCPHYAEPSLKSLKCWANYGAPKIWKYRPGPMTGMEKAGFFAGLLLILLPPVFFLLLQGRYIYAAGYSVVLIGWKMALRRWYCRRCINFSCPLNAVEESAREDFRLKMKQ